MCILWGKGVFPLELKNSSRRRRTIAPIVCAGTCSQNKGCWFQCHQARCDESVTVAVAKDEVATATAAEDDDVAVAAEGDDIDALAAETDVAVVAEAG